NRRFLDQSSLRSPRLAYSHSRQDALSAASLLPLSPCAKLSPLVARSSIARLRFSWSFPAVVRLASATERNRGQLPAFGSVLLLLESSLPLVAPSSPRGQQQTPALRLNIYHPLTLCRIK
ncbi:hypothetical protein A4X03_0g7462, partial [Tilletia caries]